MIIKILIDIIIFNIIYATINWGVAYWKNVVIYAICFMIKSIIVFGGMSLSLCFVFFGMFLAIGMFMIWMLEKIADSLNIVWFCGIAIVTQEIILLIIELFI